ncbi:MAG: hypothetical protein QM722_00530 [Piscinibacter sp.]
MQIALDFGAVGDVAWMRDRLRERLGQPGPGALRTPIGQLVKSAISSRTRDEVSAEAHRRLVAAYPDWSALAAAPAAAIETVIGDVKHPGNKARHLGAALRMVAAHRPDFDLAFLGGLGVADALAWLERLPGVGRKVAASTLNFSTLDMPAFVIDTHVLRVLCRLGFVRRKADIHAAYRTVMAAAHRWSAEELRELHVLMKRLGQTLCQFDRALCPDCPIRRRCRTAAVSPRGLAHVRAA